MTSPYRKELQRQLKSNGCMGNTYLKIIDCEVCKVKTSCRKKFMDNVLLRERSLIQTNNLRKQKKNG